MSSFAEQPNAADARRAAALIIHGRRGDSDGIKALLAEADGAGRITELVLAVLDLYRHVIGELRSDSGTGLIAAYVAQTCQLAEEASPDTGVGSMVHSAQLLNAYLRGDVVGVNKAFREAATADRSVHFVVGLLDLLEVLLPELSCEAGFDWLNQCVAIFAAEEARGDGNT